MRKALSITLMLVVALAVPALAKPVDQTGGLQKFMLEGSTPSPNLTSNTGVFGLATSGVNTTYFGGTVWAADSARWEALPDSVWTFDSGVGSHFDMSAPFVNPYKAVGLHAYMEGWYGVDATFGELPYFRRIGGGVGDSTCVVAGSYSMFAGLFEDEAKARCWGGWPGGGYGNNWLICMNHDTGFMYSGTGGVSLAYDYSADTEPGYDYTYVLVDTANTLDGTMDAKVLASETTGPAAGSMALTLAEGVDMRSDAGLFNIKFCASSDGGWSDEDGLYASACGALTIDNVVLTGFGSWNFEAGAGGWAVSAPVAGKGGDWSNIVSASTVGPVTTACGCNFMRGGKDTVLVFEDLSIPGHGYYQNQVAMSPWIDLLAADRVGAPRKFLRFDAYFDLPLENYIFYQWYTQWYPEVCAETGKLIVSVLANDNTVYYGGPVPICRQTIPGGIDNAVYRNLATYVASGAEQVRVGLGVINMDEPWGPGTGATNDTPWFDNVTFGAGGVPGAPSLSIKDWDVPQDSFPENGSLRIDAAGRLDSNNVLGAGEGPNPFSSLGDTAVVGGASGGAEVYVQFAVDPGPGCTAAVPAWIASEPGIVYEQTKNGLNWYSARMDTAQVGVGIGSGFWMTAFHEASASFSGTDVTKDPGDLDPYGNMTRLENDIFPDDLFTPGTRVNMFFKTKFLSGTAWSNLPDTTNSYYFEIEVLPSSMAADSTFNCVLYVNHFGLRGAAEWIEPALGAILTGSSANWEGRAWDRWDVQAPSSNQCSFGRAINTEYGATLVQTLGYRAIVYACGNTPSFNLIKEDADVFIPWATLTEPGLGFNNLYLSGNDLAQSISTEAPDEPSALYLLNQICGVTYTCGTLRDPGCPASSVQDTSGCVPIDPVTGSPRVAGILGPRGAQHVGQGNGCPALRSFDVLGMFSGGMGTPMADEEYDAPVKGVVQYASITNLAEDGPDYKTVVDGISLQYRRDGAGPCAYGDISLTPNPVVQERLEEVLTWFGYTGSPAACEDRATGTSVPGDPRQPTFKTGLANFAPNPLLNGAKGTIQFTLARSSKAAVEIFDVNGRLVRSVFDGVAKEGLNVVNWDGTDSGSRPVASGVYFYRLKANDEEFAKKLVVVRNGN